MLKSFITWKFAVAILLTFSVFGVLNATVLQDRYCPVIDDFRIYDTSLISDTFNKGKIAYYVDFQQSHQILVEQSQVNDAYELLSNLGIANRSNLTASCRVVH